MNKYPAYFYTWYFDNPTFNEEFKKILLNYLTRISSKSDISYLYKNSVNKLINKTNELKTSTLKISKTVRLLKYSNYEKYLTESSIKNFLSFLLSKNKLNGDIRVVSHSSVMKNFLESELSYTGNTSSLYDDNLWSIFLSSDSNVRVNITRHAFSIANIYKERAAKYKISFLQKFRQILVPDPSLSLYGIISSLFHGEFLHQNEDSLGMTTSPDIIFVSVLIRTWMTAICLYLPYCKSNEFKLIVSPFIKEVGRTPDNQPIDIKDQLLYIKSFLNLLIRLKKILELEPKYQNSILYKNLEKIYNFFFVKKGELLIETKIKSSNDNDIPIIKIYKFKITESKIDIKLNGEIENDNEINYYAVSDYNFNQYFLLSGEKKPNNLSLSQITMSCEPHPYSFDGVLGHEKIFNLPTCRNQLVRLGRKKL
jgi:hypothetical protein